MEAEHTGNTFCKPFQFDVLLIIAAEFKYFNDWYILLFTCPGALQKSNASLKIKMESLFNPHSYCPVAWRGSRRSIWVILAFGNWETEFTCIVGFR